MYTALYRKYRSKTFDEIMGQDSIVKILKNQVKNGNISHAYLFSGTRGTGKTSCAKILARAINCLNENEGNPCNTCKSCEGILDGSLMDVVEMDAASNNGVDDIRELKEKVVYPPTSLKYKVYIIDEVHMLSKGAFNALLKILEEPPKHLVFILATTEPERIPTTILSRCQRFNFRRISRDTIIENLKKISQEEGKKCDEKIFKLIASKSDGAMRDALSLLDQVLAFGDDVSFEMALDILGMASEEELLKLAGAILQSDMTSAFNLLKQILYSGKDVITVFKDLIQVLRDILVYKSEGSDENLIYSYKKEDLDSFSSFGKEDILRSMTVLSEKSQDAKFSFDPRVVLELAIIEIISFEDVKKSLAKTETKTRGKEEKDEIFNKNQADILEPETLEEQEPSQNKLKEESEKEVESKKEEKISTAFEFDFKDFVEELDDTILKSLMGHIKSSDFSNNMINFYVENEFNLDMLKSSEKSLAQSLEVYMKRPIEFRISVRTPAKEEARAKLEELFGKEKLDIQ